jgi:hypothetical protein
MTGNAFFPTPTPTLATLETSIDSCDAALSLAQDGSRTKIAAKNERRAELIQVLIALGNYVIFESGSNEVMLLSSGFPVSKQREPMPPLENPQILKLEDGPNAGDLKIAIGAVKGSRTYVYQYTQDPLTADSEWTGLNSTLTKFIFSQLQSGKKYWCRVLAYGTKDQVVYSDPVARIVQ